MRKRLRPCLERGCPNLTEGNRCEEHAWSSERNREQERAERRRTEEPWRYLYSTPAWKDARARRLEQDGHQCTARVVNVVRGLNRCSVTTGLEVDHTVPLKDLWHEAAGDRAYFERAATDLSLLRSKCKSHHRRDELLRG